jgi:energy-coupling factor transporter ATP-binding protein EcfA2
MEIKLPTGKVPAQALSPRNLIIFSKPKTGKTTLLSQLDNCLILDLEQGSIYLEAMKVEANSIADIKAVGKAIKEAGNPYDYVAVDTITALEEMCIPYAEELYMKTPMGKNWPTDGKLKYGTIIGLPNGAGYQYLREAFTKVVAYIQTWAPRIILVGHVKDTVLEKNGSDYNSLDLDLTGKLKRITASNSDSIGYLYRKGKKNILSFKTSDDIACGARPKHLSNEEIVLSEMDENGDVVTHWNKIYID